MGAEPPGPSGSNPDGIDLGRQEQAYLDAERRRLVYVACTRACDLLVVPRAGTPTDKLICGKLLNGDNGANVHTLGPYVEGQGAAWAEGIEPLEHAPITDGSDLESQVRADWDRAVESAPRQQFRPVGVSVVAHLTRGPADDALLPQVSKTHEGRHWALFGTTVHRALELVLTGQVTESAKAVAHAISETGLTENVAAVAADVEHGLRTLGEHSLLPGGEATVRLEYPIAGKGEGGELLVGSIDLLAADDSNLSVVDFKTDAPPKVDVRAERAGYVEQVRLYAQLVRDAGLAASREVRCGLLFTADGGIHWV